MKIESTRFPLPIEFYETGEMYVNVDGVDISLDHNGVVKMVKGHRTTTISLEPPSEEEIATRNGWRNCTYQCGPLQPSQYWDAVE
ncbi:unnamed protein product [Schistosoma margrebowiei]|uniref:Uncharacterized protein n=1 Tax=Schistosoma margrebowiei TaxID=48269 RepID=A0AA85A7M6_9TREM|nr:unnamed protein product [Schistosoma margrebowiei]